MSSLKIMDIPVKRIDSLKHIEDSEIKSCSSIVFLNKKEHKPMLASTRVATISENYIFWDNEDVDAQFPLETIFSIIDNVCDLFQKEYSENTKITRDYLKSKFFGKFRIFKDHKNSMIGTL